MSLYCYKEASKQDKSCFIMAMVHGSDHNHCGGFRWCLIFVTSEKTMASVVVDKEDKINENNKIFKISRESQVTK